MRQKMDIKPILNDSYLDDLNSRYSGLKIDRSEQIRRIKKRFEDKTTIILLSIQKKANKVFNFRDSTSEQVTNKQKELFENRLVDEWAVPDLPVIASEAEPEPEVDDYPPLSNEQRQWICQLIDPRANPNEVRQLFFFLHFYFRFVKHFYCLGAEHQI